MPKIITSQEAKKLFLSNDFPQKGYFVIEMKERPYARVTELGEHMTKMKKKKKSSVNSNQGDPKTSLFKRVKNKLKEMIL